MFLVDQERKWFIKLQWSQGVCLQSDFVSLVYKNPVGWFNCGHLQCPEELGLSGQKRS